MPRRAPPISTIWVAARSRIRCPDERSTTTLSTLPSARIATRQQQAAVELLRARRFGIIEIADALDLQPPVLDIARKAILLGARADEAPLRPLLVGVHVLGDLRFEPHRLRACAASARSRVGSSVRSRRLVRLGLRHRDRRRGLELRHHFARALLERLDLLRRDRELRCWRFPWAAPAAAFSRGDWRRCCRRRRDSPARGCPPWSASTSTWR